MEEQEILYLSLSFLSGVFVTIVTQQIYRCCNSICNYCCCKDDDDYEYSKNIV